MATFFRADGWVKSVLGTAIAGASIYICTQPTDAAFLPPEPLASIFSDPAGLIPIVQPIITDGFGHYDYYAASGVPYTEVVVNAGKVQQVYQDQVPMGATLGSSGAGTVTNTSGPLTLNQLVVGNGGSDIKTGPTFPGDPTMFLNGNGIFSVPAGSGSGTVTNTGALTAGQLVFGNGGVDITEGTPFPGDATKFLDGTGAFSTPSGSAVSSVFGRTGAVTAQSGDYSFSLLSGVLALGQIPAGGSSSTFLRGDGAWATPGGSGTVTSVAAGTGLSASPSPITGSGTISLADTAVTPGSYTNTNLTVDQQGRITAASNGSGGGSSLPALASFTFVNQGSSTAVQRVANGPILVTLADTGGTLSWNGLFVSTPATPYKVSARLRGFMNEYHNSTTIGVYFYDGTKMEGAEFLVQGTGTVLRVQQLTNVNTPASTIAALGTQSTVYPLNPLSSSDVWVQLRNDGTTLFYDWSTDGKNFINLTSELVGTFITPTQYGFGGVCITGGAEPYITNNLIEWNTANNANL